MRGENRHVREHDLNFTYRDGSCDEAAFVKDEIHLSAHGVYKLLSNVSLSQPQKPATSKTTTNSGHFAGNVIGSGTEIWWRNIE